MLREQKKLLRREVQAVLKSLTDAEVAADSSAVWARCLELPHVAQCSGASVYLDMACEVRTGGLITELFARGKRVFVPCIVGGSHSDMRMVEVSAASEIAGWPRNKWGIPELPVAEALAREDMACSGCIDVVFTPGVAFTAAGERLGHGKGYYDSFFARATEAHNTLGRAPPAAIGLALEKQIVEKIPTDVHDVRLTAVVAPGQVYQTLSA